MWIAFDFIIFKFIKYWKLFVEPVTQSREVTCFDFDVILKNIYFVLIS